MTKSEAAGKKRRRWTRWLWLGGALVLAVVGAAWLLEPGHFARAGMSAAAPGPTVPKSATPVVEATPAISVEAVAAQKVGTPLPRTVQVVGSFAGYDEVTVMAEVSGRVVQVFHEVGDIVRPGDVLLKIDPTDYELARQETRRSLELDATRVGIPIPPDEKFVPEVLLPMVNAFDINTLPSILRAREQEANAKRRLERSRTLVQQNSTSIESFEQLETDHEVARNNRLQVEMDCRAVMAGIKHRLVQLQIAEQKLRRTNVVVPEPTRRQWMPENVEYSVAERKVTEGEMLKDSPGSSTETFDLVLDAVLKFRAAVPERYIGEVKVDQNLTLQVDAYPGREFQGTIRRVSPVVDPLSRTFQVEATVPNASRELRPGGFAKGSIRTGEDPHAIIVPQEAIYAFVGSTRVFVVRDGKAQAVPVTTGLDVAAPDKEAAAGKSRWVELVNPDSERIQPGSLVITTGHHLLSDGTPVELRQTPRAKSAAAAKQPLEQAK